MPVLTKWGKCIEPDCGVKVTQKKEFVPQLDMFRTDVPTGITAEMREQIIAWRDEPVYCERHRR